METSRRILGYGMAASLLVVLGCYVDSALRSYPLFDGAMNLNVARSVAEGHGYGFRYDGFFAFPVQTDGPFVLPAALLFRLFGVGLVTSQFVSLAYLLGFALAVVLVLRRMGAAPFPAAGGALACLLTPGMGDFGVNGFGEVPMLFWLLAGLLAAGRDRHGLAGLLFGAALLTKAVAALCVAPAALACVVHVLTGPDRRRLRSLAWLAAGLLVPPLGWELFRLASLGGPVAWERWWALQLDQVARQSGAGEFAGPGATLARLRRHLGLLSAEVMVPPIPLSAWLVGPWLLTLARLASRRRSTAREPALLLGLLLACTLPYAAWWLLVTPTDMAWLRRMLPALLLQTCLVAALAQPPAPSRADPTPNPGTAHGTTNGTTHGTGRPWAGLLVLLLLVLPGEALMLRAGLSVSPRAARVMERRDTDRMVDALRALPPDAVIFGTGWWQAPLLALLSGRTVMNLDLWDPARVNALPHAFFVVDPAAAELSGNRLQQVTRTASLRPLLIGHDMALYRIAGIDPDRPLRDPTPLVAGFDGRAVAQASGWYLPDGGWAWVDRHSRIRLARTGQTRLVLDAAFWDELFARGPLHLRVQADGCLDETVTVPSSGSRRIVLPLRCAPRPVAVPVTVTLDIEASMPRPHQLDVDTRDRAFQVRRLMLEP